MACTRNGSISTAGKRFFNTSSLQTFFIISVSAVFFGLWFATEQVSKVAADAIHSYSLFYFALTVFKCYLTVIVFWLSSAIVLSYASNCKISPLMTAYTFLPLIGLYILRPFYWAAAGIIVLQAVLVVLNLPARNGTERVVYFLPDLMVFLLFFVLHYALTTRFSPSHWDISLFTANGQTSEEAWVLAPVYQGFLLAKQFAFNYVDHSQWAGIMNTPVSLKSTLMQLLAFILDLPGISIVAFHTLISAINFTLIVLGSFGCYLFLRYAASLSLVFSILGGLLYFFGGDPHIERMFTSDAGIFLSSYAVFPYALLLISLAFQRNSLILSTWSGVALASQFFFVYPHPESVIYSFLFFGLYSSSMCYFSTELPVSRRKKLLVSAMTALILLSAFIILPVVYDRLTQNMYVFAHTGDIAAANFSDFKQYILIIAAAIFINTNVLKQSTRSGIYRSSLFLAACICLLAFISTSRPLLRLVAKKLHIGIHFWFTWRYGMYFSFMVVVISMYTLDGLVKKILPKDS